MRGGVMCLNPRAAGFVDFQKNRDTRAKRQGLLDLMKHGSSYSGFDGIFDSENLIGKLQGASVSNLASHFRIEWSCGCNYEILFNKYHIGRERNRLPS